MKQLTNEKSTRMSVIEDARGNLQTETSKSQERCTEYIKDLYNYHISTISDILTTLEGGRPSSMQGVEPEISESENEETGRNLKNGKSVGVDNMPPELIKNGGKITIDVFFFCFICNLVWNYRTISLIGHPSKVLLRVIDNRIKHKAERILYEKQDGFRNGRNTVEKTGNVRIPGEKYWFYPLELHRNFIDFKKAFSRVFISAVWLVMIKIIEALYSSSSDGALEWFQATVDARQGCILSTV